MSSRSQHVKMMPRQTVQNNDVVSFHNTSAAAHILFIFLVFFIYPTVVILKSTSHWIYFLNFLMLLFDLPTSEIIWFTFKSGAQSFLLLTMLIRPTLTILLLLRGESLKCFFVVIVVGWCLKSTALPILATRCTHELSDQSDWIVSLAEMTWKALAGIPCF